MTELFNSIFYTSDSVITPLTFILCIVTALVSGSIFAFTYTIKNKYTYSYLCMLALLPIAITVVIMMVNGNIGVGLATAGTLSLVRFRSAQGNAKEICVIFLAMASGLVAGMGYLTYAILYSIIANIIVVFVSCLISYKEKINAKKELRIIIPEDLNYTQVFNDIFEKYLSSCERISARTTNMGSLFKLTYIVTLKDNLQEKTFIDELRTRNGNLEIIISDYIPENTL